MMPSSSKIFLVRPCYIRVIIIPRPISKTRLIRIKTWSAMEEKLHRIGVDFDEDIIWCWSFFFFVKKVRILRLSLLFAWFFFASWVDDERSRMIFFFINKSYCTRVLEVLLLLEHTTCNSTWKNERAFDVFMYIFIYERIVEIALYLLLETEQRFSLLCFTIIFKNRFSTNRQIWYVTSIWFIHSISGDWVGHFWFNKI